MTAITEVSICIIPTCEKIASVERHLRRLRPGTKGDILRDALKYAFEATKDENSIPATTFGPRFRNFMTLRGEKAPFSSLYHAVAAAEIASVIAQFPELTTRGLGRDLCEVRQGEAEGVTFSSDQAQLFSLQNLRGFLASAAFLEAVPKTKSLRNFARSYWIKDIAERHVCNYPDGERLGPTPVSHGSLIAAAIFKGFGVGTYKDEFGRSREYVIFNMPFRVLNQFGLPLHATNAAWLF